MIMRRNRSHPLPRRRLRGDRLLRGFLPFAVLFGGCVEQRDDDFQEEMSEFMKLHKSRAGKADPGYIVSIAREEKDRTFRGDPSPIPEEERGAFRGLRYYPYDITFRVVGTFEPLDSAEEVTLGTSTGEPRRSWLAGTIRFTVGDVEETLNAYVDEGDTNRLFIPFRDRTNGRETYGAGRYLEAERDSRWVRNDGDVVLDFNKAYNPYCAYNAEYSCPLVPAENNLGIEIEAGEMTYTHD
jgi:uncharacterized protein (DUF1684 family)